MKPDMQILHGASLQQIQVGAGAFEVRRPLCQRLRAWVRALLLLGAPGSSGFTPGIGLNKPRKLLRDGRPSSNFVAMPGLDGQPCNKSNFFSRDFTTHIKAGTNFALKLVAAKFWQASYCPLMVGTSDFADGQKGKFPFELVLRSKATVECPCMDYDQCLKNLATDLKPGQVFFEVYANEKPGAAEEFDREASDRRAWPDDHDLRGRTALL